jgi:hypothetical protein
MNREQAVALGAIMYIQASWVPRCPFHGQRDCSALLNGCSVPNKIKQDLDEFIDELAGLTDG